jgi:nucleotide-binding universal stress UspA family protein
MKIRLRRILCPIDFDRISIPAIEFARELARQNDAVIYLLSVVPRERTQLKTALQQVAQDSLRAVARKWLEPKISHQIVVRIGQPAKAVVEAEVEFKADLVVMATHGRTGRNRARLGSVTEEVVRRSTCPVLTLRPS